MTTDKNNTPEMNQWRQPRFVELNQNDFFHFSQQEPRGRQNKHGCASASFSRPSVCEKIFVGHYFVRQFKVSFLYVIHYIRISQNQAMRRCLRSIKKGFQLDCGMSLIVNIKCRVKDGYQSKLILYELLLVIYK